MTSPGEAITRAELREAIDDLFATECDIALLYFSGHGLVRNADVYIVASDAKKYDEGISMTEILAMANASPVKNKVILLDCCSSGNMGTPSIAYEETEPGHDPANVAIIKDLQKMEGAQLMAPVGEEHMYYAAINSKSCRLPALGFQYWRLAREKKL
jgi:hypothetical protein